MLSVPSTRKLFWNPRTPPNDKSPLESEVRPRGSWVTPGVRSARSVKRLPFRGNPWMACWAMTCETSLPCVSTASGCPRTVTVCVSPATAPGSSTTPARFIRKREQRTNLSCLLLMARMRLTPRRATAPGPFWTATSLKTQLNRQAGNLPPGQATEGWCEIRQILQRMQALSREVIFANFVGWVKDHVLFDRELEKIIRALRTDDGGREKPPPARL